MNHNSWSLYSTYIIKSISHNIFYIGHTNNLEDRIKRHNTNRNKYTAGKGPWELIYQYEFDTRKEAGQKRNLNHLKTENIFLTG